MDDDELGSGGQSVNGESDEEFDMNSEDDNNSASLNIGEDPNSSEDDIDPAVAVQAFKHLKGVFSGFSKYIEKKGKSRRSGVQKCAAKDIRDVKGIGKGKSTVAESSSAKAGSRCNNKYFGETIRKLDEHKKNIIRNHGFGMLLEYDGCSVPRNFIQWLADQVDVNCCDVLVGGKVVPFSAKSVHLFLGIPIGGDDIRQQKDQSAKANFLKEIDETSLPLIKTFGNKLVGNTLCDDDVFRYFMVVALSTFLCPNLSTLPSPKYLGALVDVSTVEDWDWSKFVFEWLFASISLYRKKQRKTISGCMYFFAAYYLDFLNFGCRHQLPPNLPRILCWKGSMIRKYASYDCVATDKFGKHPVKSIEETCYAECLLPVDACASFRDSLSDCNFFNEEDNEALCGIFQEHHTIHGFRSPGKLVLSMFEYMRNRHGHRDAVDDDPLPKNSAIGIPSPANGSDKDDDAMAHELEAPMPAGSTHTIVEDVLDTTLPAASVVNVQVVDPTMSAATKINDEEVSVTEKVDSDSAYNVFGSGNCGVSQSTVIISSNNSSAQVVDLGTMKRKRKRKRKDCSQTSSPDSVACRTRHGLSQHLRKSPLSFRKNDVVEASVLNDTRSGGTKANPIVVEEARVLTSKPATKRQKLKLNSKDNVKLGAVKNVQTASSPDLHVLEPKTISCHSKESQLAENAAPALDHTGNAPIEKSCMKNKAPYFNSPSMPSFRLLDDEDDLGDYVEDPKLRHPVGSVSGTTCTLDDNSQREASALPSKAATTHQNVQQNVQSESSFFFQFCPAPEGWTFIDRMRSIPFGPSGNMSNQETVETDRNDNAENDLLHMESLPITETPKETIDHIPLAAISPSGENIDIPW